MNEENFDPRQCINPSFLSCLEQKQKNIYFIYMSNIDQVILEQLQNASDHMDWNLCVICQQKKLQDLQNPNDKRGKEL